MTGLGRGWLVGGFEGGGEGDVQAFGFRGCGCGGGGWEGVGDVHRCVCSHVEVFWVERKLVGADAVSDVSRNESLNFFGNFKILGNERQAFRQSISSLTNRSYTHRASSPPVSITMASTTCWRCLSRAADHAPSLLRSHPAPSLTAVSFFAPFTTSARVRATPAKGGRPPPRGTGPKRGQGTTFTVKKKKRRDTNAPKGRPPAPGERKALRKRIVLSNVNALEVRDMQDLTPEAMIDMRLRGQVIGIPGPVVDQLRVLEAFKVSQGWGLFRRPGMLVRRETVEYGRMFEELSGENSGKVVRRVLVGEKGSGKSMMVLQAMSMALLKGWIVINIPNGKNSLALSSHQHSKLTPSTSHGSHHGPYRIRPPPQHPTHPIHPKNLHRLPPLPNRPRQRPDPLQSPTLPNPHPPHPSPAQHLPGPPRRPRRPRPGHRLARLPSPLDRVDHAGDHGC